MKKPPKIATLILNWFVRQDYRDELVGDLEENFYLITADKGLRQAKWNYYIETLKLFRPSVWKKPSLKIQNSNFMFRNYTKVTFRNLGRQRLFSFINLSGLALSLSVCLLIVSIIVDQLSFDKFHENYNSIYRVITHNKDLKYGWSDRLATTSLPLYEYLEEHSDVEKIVRVRRNFWADVDSDSRIIPLSGHMVDSEFLQIFSFKLITGNPEKALSHPFSIVLTQTSRDKLFGNEEAIGKTINVGRYGDYIVTGIMEDPPRNSHMQFDMLGSFSSLEALRNSGIQSGVDNWEDYTGNYIYFTTLGSTENIQNLLTRVGSVESKKLSNRELTFELQSLASITPGRDLANQIGPTFSKSGIGMLSGLSVVILLLACFNYVNLTLAKSIRRFKEVGIRKVMGSQRKQLIFQFVFEAVLLSVLAVVPAFLLMIALKPQFFSIVSENKARFLTFEITPSILFAVIAFSIITGVLAGLIPALVMSKVKVAQGLRDKMIIMFTGVSLRKGLVVLQFGIALFFLTITSLAYNYYKHHLNFDLGYSYNDVYNINLQGVNHAITKSVLEQIPEVESVSFSSYILSTSTKNTHWIVSEDKQDTIRAVNLRIDEGYIKLHKFKLLAGNDFGDFAEGNESRLVVNESLIKRLGIDVPGSAINKTIWLDGNEMIIGGVVKDFYHNNSNQPIEPFFFRYSESGFSYANLKIRSDNMLLTLSKLEDAWKKIDNGVHDYEGMFYSAQIDESMDEIKALIKLVGFAASLTIFIAILGILGMIVYTFETKIKEIGIRKVLGASIPKIIYTLSKGFMSILIFASLIAIAAVYILYNNVIAAELTNKPVFTFFNYAGGVISVLIIGVLIIVLNGYISASRNPVESLKEE